MVRIREMSVHFVKALVVCNACNKENLDQQTSEQKKLSFLNVLL